MEVATAPAQDQGQPPSSSADPNPGQGQVQGQGQGQGQGPGQDHSKQTSVRGDARNLVAEKWANKRRQQQEQHLQQDQQQKLLLQPPKVLKHQRDDTRNNAGLTKNQQQHQHQHHHALQPLLPPLCVLLQRSWKEALKSFQPKSLPSSAPPSHQNAKNKPIRTANDKDIKPARPTFPSVLKILNENALVQQVKSFAQDESYNDQEQQLQPSLQVQAAAPALLSVLPADYNFQRAITEMARSRSRVFWLLDLAAITHAYVNTRKLFKGKVQLAYRLHHNPSPKLVTVLQRLGVALQVATPYEIDVCRQLRRQHLPNTSVTLLDDPNIISKPNSFYRRLVLTRPTPPQGAAPTPTPPITVNGPKELIRLTAALANIASRRNHALPSLNFILQLNASDSLDGWKALFDTTQKSLVDALPADNTSHSLVGIALRVPDSSSSKVSLETFFQNILSFMEYTQTHIPANNGPTSKLQLHLTNPTPLLDPVLVRWLTTPKLLNNCPNIILDVSHLLVANASALCTRIIGVKQTEPGKINYYIDDGCYGSLANVSSADCSSCEESPPPKQPQRHPLPLQSMHTTPTSPVKDAGFDEVLLATVWGPTCDGLDKVCSDIQLPRLGRDDWLVFGDIGFCHVGTAFNGFEPPDIAYCVLGQAAAAGLYHDQQQQQQQRQQIPIRAM